VTAGEPSSNVAVEEFRSFITRIAPTGTCVVASTDIYALIQDFLGHASIANTVRYTMLAPRRLAAVRVR
jgi:hypothetical protein